MTDANDQPNDDLAYKVTNPDFGTMVVYGMGLRAARKEIESGKSKYPTWAAYYERVWAQHGKSAEWLDQCIWLADIIVPEGATPTPTERSGESEIVVLGNREAPFPRIAYCKVFDGARTPLQSPEGSVAVPDFDESVILTFLLLGERATASPPVTITIVADTGRLVLSLGDVSLFQVVAADQTAFLFTITTRYPGPGGYRFKVVVDGRDHFVAPFELTEGVG
jgi:hypothetical protein